jgi:hypothetical protein
MAKGIISVTYARPSSRSRSSPAGTRGRTASAGMGQWRNRRSRHCWYPTGPRARGAPAVVGARCGTSRSAALSLCPLPVQWRGDLRVLHRGQLHPHALEECGHCGIGVGAVAIDQHALGAIVGLDGVEYRRVVRIGYALESPVLADDNLIGRKLFPLPTASRRAPLTLSSCVNPRPAISLIPPASDCILSSFAIDLSSLPARKSRRSERARWMQWQRHVCHGDVRRSRSRRSPQSVEQLPRQRIACHRSLEAREIVGERPAKPVRSTRWLDRCHSRASTTAFEQRHRAYAPAFRRRRIQS